MKSAIRLLPVRMLLLMAFSALLTPALFAAEPCCNIVSVDVRAGVVTARDTATGRVFRFQATDRATLRSLRPGQPVYANFQTNQVSLDGKRACCAILKAAATVAPGATASPASAGTPAKGVEVPSTRPAADADSPPPSSGDDGEEDDSEDPEPPHPPRKQGPGMALAALSRSRPSAQLTPLSGHPDRQKIVDELLRGLRGRSIDVALIGGEKYMINRCLGIKASAGKFKLDLENPDLRFDGSGAVLTFEIPRISMSGLSIRVRPNVSNPLKTCKFSKRKGVGGSAKGVRMIMRFDPLLDLQQCKLGSMGSVKTTWRIDNVNLKPLQNDLDRMAKNMIEDSLTYASNFNLTDRIIAAFNGAIGAQCKTAATD